MKPYPLPSQVLDLVLDSDTERTELVGALYATNANGEKIILSELWLHGTWLEEAGFEIGDQVAIHVQKNQLILQKLDL